MTLAVDDVLTKVVAAKDEGLEAFQEKFRVRSVEVQWASTVESPGGEYILRCVLKALE